jgi:hypothetical protein
VTTVFSFTYLGYRQGGNPKLAPSTPMGGTNSPPHQTPPPADPPPPVQRACQGHTPKKPPGWLRMRPPCTTGNRRAAPPGRAYDPCGEGSEPVFHGDETRLQRVQRVQRLQHSRNAQDVSGAGEVVGEGSGEIVAPCPHSARKTGIFARERRGSVASEPSLPGSHARGGGSCQIQ